MVYPSQIMKREGFKFNWSNFMEGLSWAIFSMLTFCGLGISGIVYKDRSPDNLWLGIFLIVLGVILTVFCVIESFDMAWERK